MPQVVYDVETFPNIFCACFKEIEGEGVWFEISHRRHDGRAMADYLMRVRTLIGFNCMAFDWLIIKAILNDPMMSAAQIYELAQTIIVSDRYEVMDWRPAIPQIDLFLIHHFDNPAKRTSLKKLEFNMRSPHVQSLPFAVGSHLNDNEMDDLLMYNANDVLETERFYYHSKPLVDFRNAINPEWMNRSSTAIGRKYFEQALINQGVAVKDDNYQVINTKRPGGVRLSDVIIKTPLFDMMPKLIEDLGKITVFTSGKLFAIDEKEQPWEDFSFQLGNIQVSIGLGGIHGSVNNKAYLNGGVHDFDVTSFYPNLSIQYGIYPEHLGPIFCKVNQTLLSERLQHPKGTPPNQIIKDALNSVFGSSGSEFTSFFDIKYLLGTTINGQLLLLSLAAELLQIPDLELIQINTDGVTVYCPESNVKRMNEIIDTWRAVSMMPLEQVDYRRMWIRDVNNYIAEYKDGTRKLKGAYSYKRQWWQNHSMLVVPRVVEKVMCDGADPMEMLQAANPWDFMMRLDLTGSSYIETSDGQRYSGVVRYYVAEDGVSAVKHMPRTKTKIHGKGHAEAQGHRGHWTCSACGKTYKRKVDCESHMDKEHSSKLVICQDYDGGAINPDYRFYLSEINKLVIK